MAEDRLFAGHQLRRLRMQHGLSQVALAEILDISPSYVTLLERNQRPLSATVLLRLADRLDFDPRTLNADQPAGGAEMLARRIADPLFAELGIDRAELVEWLAAAPRTAEAFARLYDRADSGGGGDEAGDTATLVRREIERWRNHFADLDALAETIAEELRLVGNDLYGAIADRLRSRHRLTVRRLPAAVLGATLRRIDLHARQLQLSESLGHASRTFQAAIQLGLVEASGEIDALARGAKFVDGGAEALYRRHLAAYFAAALMMPYARFLRACDDSGYDIEILERRFDASFEMVAHRLTTLQRVGASGVPFFMVRIDRAGQFSKRYAGASASPLARHESRCALWAVPRAFAEPGRIVRQLAELEDGSRWLTIARSAISPYAGPEGIRAEFAIGLGVAADHAQALVYARGVDLAGPAVPIGLGCRRCYRAQCPQRAVLPSDRAATDTVRERTIAPLTLAGD
ncbi:MAG: DUF2083 domain-containing protein [Sphingomonadales bacterium]|nr:DUF2083 domain-containing protein [Sphingomonadales bacterium]